jgi:hypothetical protein
VDGSTRVARVVETSGRVQWLGVDSTHLYWVEAMDDSGSQYAISRIGLPK